MESKLNPYEPSASPVEALAKTTSSQSANDLDLTSYGVLAIALLLGLYSLLSLGTGIVVVMQYASSLLQPPPPSGPGLDFMNAVERFSTPSIGQGIFRLGIGSLAALIVWNCRNLFLRLRAASRGEEGIELLIPAQRKCWTLGAIFLTILVIVTIVGPAFRIHL